MVDTDNNQSRPAQGPGVGSTSVIQRDLNQLTRRGKVIYELYTTEHTYVENLEVLVSRKQDMLKDPRYKNLKSNEKLVISKMFECLEKLYQSQKALLAEIEKLDKAINEPPEDAARVESIFSSIEPLIASTTRLHTQYIALYQGDFFDLEKASRAISELKAFNVIESAQKNVILGSFLILPVQRGPRYEMLLSDFAKQTRNDFGIADDNIPDPLYSPLPKARNLVALIKAQLSRGNQQANEIKIKNVKQLIYQGNIPLDVMKDYAAKFKEHEIKKNQEERTDVEEQAFSQLEKDLKELKKSYPVLPKALQAYSDLDASAAKLIAGNPVIGWPTFVVQTVSNEPKPTSETLGNIQISIDISKDERKAIKSRLRNLDPDIVRLLPNQFQIVETQKEVGIRAGFLVKDQAGINVLHVVVEKGEVRIRELNSSSVNDEDKLKMMHELCKALNYQDAKPTIISTDVDKIRRLNEISINEGLPTYAQASEEKRALHKKIVNDGQSQTTGIILREIDIQCKGNLPEDIKERVQEVINQGLFVPRLVNDSKLPPPLLTGEVTIATEVPLLAIKQYEAALNAGLTPVFSDKAKSKVQDFVKKQLNANSSDTQVAINVPFESRSITGAQVLERVKQASKDGFIVKLSTQAQKNLKEHIATLKADAPSLQYELPMKHSHVAAIVNSLLAVGLSPDTQAFSKAKMDELRHLLRSDAKDNNSIVFVDSGNIARDFSVLKNSYTELGHRVDLEPKNTKFMLGYLQDKPLQHFDLQHLPPDEQLLCAQRLAQCGIHAVFTADIPPQQAIFIRSKNIDHAKEMFQSYLNQGFFPVGNKRIRELSEQNIPISISSLDPKVIWERMDHCAQSGLAIALTDEQIKIMKKFSEKNHPALPINGYGWGAVKHNIELANELGMNIRGITNNAQAAYLRAQVEAKQKGQPDIPRINIKPIYKTQSRFLRSDISVEDRARTLAFANSLFKGQININMTGLEVMEERIKTASEKKKWFGWSNTKTDKAKKAEAFLTGEWQQMKENVKALTSSFTSSDVASLTAKADKLSPTPVAKVKKPPVPLVRSNTLDRIPPVPVPRPAQAVPGQRQAFIPGAQGAQTQSAVMPGAPASAPAPQAVTIDEVLQAFQKIRAEAFKDQMVDTRANRIYINADQICTMVQNIKMRPADVQMQELRDLMVKVSEGDKSVLSQPPKITLIHEQIQQIAKGFSERMKAAPVRRLGNN